MTPLPLLLYGVAPRGDLRARGPPVRRGIRSHNIPIPHTHERCNSTRRKSRPRGVRSFACPVSISQSERARRLSFLSPYCGFASACVRPPSSSCARDCSCPTKNLIWPSNLCDAFYLAMQRHIASCHLVNNPNNIMIPLSESYHGVPRSHIPFLSPFSPVHAGHINSSSPTDPEPSAIARFSEWKVTRRRSSFFRRWEFGCLFSPRRRLRRFNRPFGACPLSAMSVGRSLEGGAAFKRAAF